MAGDPVRLSDPTGLILPLLLGIGAVALAIAGGIRFCYEAKQIFDDARQGKIDDNVFGDDEKLEDRLRNEVPDLIQRTKKLAEEQFEDQYITGPVGEVGGDGAKIVIEGYNNVEEMMHPQ